MWYPVAGGGGPFDIPDLPSSPFSLSFRSRQPGASLKPNWPSTSFRSAQATARSSSAPRPRWRRDADGDGVVEPGEGHRYVVRIRQLRGMNGPARSYYPTTASCFNDLASRRFRINGLMGVERLTKENSPNENPKLVPWEMSAIARNPRGADGHRLSLTGPTHSSGEPSRCEAVTYLLPP